MNALPTHPTERDRERFEAQMKSKFASWGFNFERLIYDSDGVLPPEYDDADTNLSFNIWWSVERERQLLQNLNQSQGVKLSELLARAEKAEEALRSLASFVGAGGYNADKVDAGVFEEKIRWGIGQIMERLEKAETELAKLAKQESVAFWWIGSDGIYSGGPFAGTPSDEAIANGRNFGCEARLLYAAPVHAVAVPADLLNKLSIVLSGEMVFDPPAHLVDAIPETWDDWDKSIYKKYLREAANSWGRRKMIRQARALLQSATQPGSEPVAHHPV
jgi:hypothetical protein